MIFENHNLLPFVMTFMPALVYALIIFVSFPRKTLSMKIAFLYFLMGSISVHAVSAIQWIFPGWSTQSESYGFLYDVAIMAFVQVALLEEGAKQVFYRLSNIYRGKLSKPMSVMFYAMCVSAGFAVVENMMYAWRFGPEVLYIRAGTSMVLHMMAGLIMGYFFALGMHINKRRILYRILGLISAVFIHGLYDFNLMIGYHTYQLMDGRVIGVPTGLGVNPWYVLGPGLAVVLVMYLHLRKLAKGKKRVSPPSEK